MSRLLARQSFAPLRPQSPSQLSPQRVLARREEIAGQLETLCRLERRFKEQTSGRPLRELELHDWERLQSRIATARSQLAELADWYL